MFLIKETHPKYRLIILPKLLDLKCIQTNIFRVCLVKILYITCSNYIQKKAKDSQNTNLVPFDSYITN